MQLVINALTDDGKLLGFVIFNIGDSRELDPQELEVVEKYRGQGVAKVMYDYVKSKGYKIIKSPDVTKISDQGTQSGEHFWQKNRGEETVWEGRENYNGINMLLQSDEDEVYVKASAGPRELGHVLFVIDGEYLLPQDLEVEPQYRGYKIAQKMYDFVKSKGYKIRRSGNQTADGSKFWAKHRPEQNVWEDSMTKGRNLSPATEKYIKNHKWKLTTVDPMSLDIDSFDDPFNRVIDIDTEHPINLKDPVIVHHNGSTILDGFHRVYQAQRQGLKSIPAYIPIQKQVSEAFTNPYNFKW
jgi:GNAT superfamily N-acetyltransferase